ncbi:hypothetical protein [Thiorhodococcus minor]|uniref:Uncharacterized protein n=1 Tax=Thiorhodococcus minor TaxID=57489 RepID=A0A6M0K6Z3_9GAMM|nr:hypothetical protein [Thiorhodococcus minor]NEV64115.1 hypothetical protein [Thiorhodococcus minor]
MSVQFTWHPKRLRKGGVAVVLSIPEQLVQAVRAGTWTAVSTSSTYHKAPMPDMGRFTSGG